jgi:TP901 family phage tail tape measure protein
MADYNISVKLDPRQAKIGARTIKKELQNVESTTDSLQKTLLRTISLLGAGAGFSYALNTLASFSQEMSTVRAITKATETQFQALNNVAKELGATTRFSATQAAEGMAFLARAGFDVDQVMGSVGDTLLLAQAGALDLGTAADIASNVLTGFRLEVTEASRVVDVLAAAANSANTSVGQMGEAAKFVAPVAAGMSVSLEESAAAIGALSDAGLQASLAGTGLRRILSELESPAEATKKIFRSLGIEADQVRISQVGLTQALKVLAQAGVDTGLALQIFGDRGGPAFEVLANAIPKVENLTNEFENAKGTARTMADTMDRNLNGALLSVKSATESLILSFGELGTESLLTKTFRALAGIIRSVANNLGELTSIVTTGAVAWTSYFAAMKIQSFYAAIVAFLSYKKAIASGNAVVLGSTTAEVQKAGALVSSRQAEVNATVAAIARTKAELRKAVIVRGGTTAEFARVAVLKQISMLETQLAAQTTALTAAKTAQSAAVAKSTGVFAKLNLLFPGLTAGVKAFTVAIAANPIGAIAVALTTVIGLLVTFRKQIKLGGERLATLGDVGTIVWQMIKKSFMVFIQFFQNNFGFVSDFANKVFGDIKISVGGLILFTAKMIDKKISYWVIGYKTIKAVWENLPIALKDIAIRAINGMIRVIENGLNQIINAMNNVLSSLRLPELIAVQFTKIENTAKGSASNLGALIGKNIAEGLEFSGVQDLIGNIFNEADKIAKKREQSAPQQDPGGTDKIDITLKKINALRGVQINQFSVILRSLKQEADLLKLTNRERQIQEQVLQIENDLKRALTITEKELVVQQLKTNQALAARAQLLSDLKGPVEEYKNIQTAANTLLKDGAISAQQYTAALQQTQLGSGFQQLQLDLMPEEDAKLAALESTLQQRLALIRQFQDAKLLTEQEASALAIEANRKHNQEILTIEQQRFKTQLRAGQNTFASLAVAAKNYAGEQSEIYRMMFAASKGFAIAETTIAIVQGIANAAKTGWPKNIVAIAATVAQTAGLLSQIQSTQLQGFESGGNFKVGGAGGADSQLVAFRASPNETVSVRTPGQEKAAIQQAQPQPTPQSIQIVNVDDPGKLEDFMTTPAGTKSVLNVIKKNPAAIKSIVG